MASKKKPAPRKRPAAKRSRPRPRPRPRAELIAGEPLKPISLESQLAVGTAARLEAFCAAHHGADPRTVIHKAIEDFIVDDLADNAAVAAECSYKPTPSSKA